MEVKRLAPSDHLFAVEVIRALKSPDGYPIPSEDHLRDFLSRPANILIAAGDGGIPVGYVVAYLLDRVDGSRGMVLFYEISVAESHRRRGVGTKMIAELKSICRAHGVAKMWVQTNRSNTAATRLYSLTGAQPPEEADEVTFTYFWDSLMNPDPAA